MKKLNIAYRLGIYIILAEILLAGALMYTGYNFTSNIIYNNLISKSKFRTQVASESMISSVDQVFESVDYLGVNIVSVNNENEIFGYASSILELKPKIEAVHIYKFDSISKAEIYNSLIAKYEGEIFEGNENFPEVIKLLKSWYNSVIDKDDSWSEPYFIEGNPYPFIAHAKVFTQNGISTVVSCILSLEDEILEFDNSTAIHKSGIAILFSKKGTILYHTDHEFIGKSYSSLEGCFPSEFFSRMPEILSGGSIGIEKIRTSCLDKKRAVVASWPITEIESIMMLLIPRSEIIGRLNTATHMLLGLSLLGIGIIIVITIFLVKLVVSPISRLVDDTKKILTAEGEVVPRNINEAAVLAGGMERLKERVEIFQNKWIETYKDKEAIDKELQLARDIEKSLIPKFPLYPDRDEFTCYADLLPARMVGGDMFDILLLDENRLLVTICDTLGKGIPAAMFSVMTRSLIRNIAGRNFSVSEIVKQLNDELSGDGESGMFVTVFLSILNVSNGELTFCNAGHTRPFIVSRNGKIKELSKSHGIPVGAMNNQQFGESKITLKTGDMLFGYSDGISEEHDAMGNLYGVDRIVEDLNSNFMKSPQKLIKSIIGSVEKFREGCDQRDDISLVAVRYNGNHK